MNVAEFAGYFDIMPIAFTVVEMVLDQRGAPVDFIFRYANQPLAELLGLELKKLLDRRFYQDVFAQNSDKKWLPHYYAAACLDKVCELHEYSPEVDKFLKIVCFPWREYGCCACILADETELVLTRDQLEYMARWDKATQLGSRNAYLEYCANVPPGHSIGVIYLDANGLKLTNDRYGHRVGDVLLLAIRDRILSIFGQHRDLIFRIGGDEFVIFLLGVSRELCQVKARALWEALNNDSDPRLPPRLAALGYAWTGNSADINCAIRAADADMYRDKQSCHYMCGI